MWYSGVATCCRDVLVLMLVLAATAFGQTAQAPQASEAVSYTTLWCYAAAGIAHLRCDFRGFANNLKLRDRGTRDL